MAGWHPGRRFSPGRVLPGRACQLQHLIAGLVVTLTEGSTGSASSGSCEATSGTDGPKAVSHPVGLSGAVLSAPVVCCSGWLAPRSAILSRRVLPGRACQLQHLIAGLESVIPVWAPRRQHHRRLLQGLMVRKLILTRWVSVERFRHYLLFSTHLACRPPQGPARPTGNCATPFSAGRLLQLPCGSQRPARQGGSVIPATAISLGGSQWRGHDRDVCAHTWGHPVRSIAMADAPALRRGGCAEPWFLPRGVAGGAVAPSVVLGGLHSLQFWNYHSTN